MCLVCYGKVFIIYLDSRIKWLFFEVGAGSKELVSYQQNWSSYPEPSVHNRFFVIQKDLSSGESFSATACAAPESFDCLTVQGSIVQHLIRTKG